MLVNDATADSKKKESFFFWHFKGQFWSCLTCLVLSPQPLTGCGTPTVNQEAKPTSIFFFYVKWGQGGG